MKEFKLTMGKVREHLGDELLTQILHHEQSSEYKLYTKYEPIAFGFIILFAMINNDPHKFFIAGFLICTSIAFYYALKRRQTWRTLSLTADRLKPLVADPELLWLNKQENLAKIPARFGRIGGKPLLDEKDYAMLEYLKTNGSSQGMHTVIKSLKNSNSVNTRLKRMAERGLVKKVQGDHEYIPWSFKIIDDPTKETRTIEETLNKAWERIINGKRNKPIFVLIQT